jgi:hypothetical protein
VLVVTPVPPPATPRTPQDVTPEPLVVSAYPLVPLELGSVNVVVPAVAGVFTVTEPDVEPYSWIAPGFVAALAPMASVDDPETNCPRKVALV